MKPAGHVVGKLGGLVYKDLHRHRSHSTNGGVTVTTVPSVRGGGRGGGFPPHVAAWAVSVRHKVQVRHNHVRGNEDVVACSTARPHAKPRSCRGVRWGITAAATAAGARGTGRGGAGARGAVCCGGWPSSYHVSSYHVEARFGSLLHGLPDGILRGTEEEALGRVVQFTKHVECPRNELKPTACLGLRRQSYITWEFKLLYAGFHTPKAVTYHEPTVMWLFMIGHSLGRVETCFGWDPRHQKVLGSD